MAIPPNKFKERIERVKRNADIKAVIESTGAQPVTGNVSTGQYTYHAPYRDDSTPSLTIFTQTQSFTDFGMTGATGDVIELTQLIHGHGDKAKYPFFDAVRWLEGFSGRSVAPKAVKPAQRFKKPVSNTIPEGERFRFVKSAAITAKTHPNQLDYITKIRGIPLEIASRHLWVITFKDTHAPLDDQNYGNRYAIGGPNDANGYEIRAASTDSKFKTALGPKDVTSYPGEKGAQTGDIFEGRFDLLTYLALTNQLQPSNPTIILNSGRLARRAAQLITSRPDWQDVKTWRIWQHADKEGDMVTQIICEEMNETRTVGTMHHLYEGYNDLNQFWTDAPEETRAALKTKMSERLQTVQKSYDTSASAEARRSHDEQIKNNQLKLF